MAGVVLFFITPVSRLNMAKCLLMIEFHDELHDSVSLIGLKSLATVRIFYICERHVNAWQSARFSG